MITPHFSSRRLGMTLVELLVVIALIGMLTALALPAINAARESGRATVCKNSLRQIALASLLHEGSQGYFPSGGWGGAWAPVPGRGFGPNQPGGWVYSVLGYLERNDVADLGKDVVGPQREAKVATLLQTPIAVLNCPSRRRPSAYPICYSYARQPFGAAPIASAARSDYAMNAGDQPRCEIASWFDPPSLEAGDQLGYTWPNTFDHTGVSFLRSRITPAHVRHGLSRTYLVGEKYLSVWNYETGADHGDDWSMYSGYQDDTHRTTAVPPARDDDQTRTCRFGSSHPMTWHIAFCDASVRASRYDIDPFVHRSLGCRTEGQLLEDGLLR